MANESPDFHGLSKIPDSGQFHGVLEAFTGPLVDRNGRWVRYTIHVNEDEYNYITTNDLNWVSGQVGKTIDFPYAGQENCLSPAGDKIPCGTAGAIEIKAAWKVLSEEEKNHQPIRFYTTQGVIYNDVAGEASPEPQPVTLGLVGLHIVHKDPTFGFVWSTFEQVDNTTSSFFKPDCSDCAPVNTETVPQPWTAAKELNPDGTPIQTPAQVVRETPIEDNAAQLNAYYRGLLVGSVWEHYEQVSTQWATGAAAAGTPEFVSNTTMETFYQKFPHTCIGCHTGATTTYCPPDPEGKPTCTSADFSFLLGGAKKKPADGSTY